MTSKSETCCVGWSTIPLVSLPLTRRSRPHLPEGSYMQTCKEIRMNGKHLIRFVRVSPCPATAEQHQRIAL